MLIDQLILLLGTHHVHSLLKFEFYIFISCREYTLKYFIKGLRIYKSLLLLIHHMLFSIPSMVDIIMIDLILMII